MTLRDKARALRKNMTWPEVLLWKKLKELNGSGYHFRRQVPLDGWILDFAEFTHRLIIEVDGPHHEGDPKDRHRDEHFMQAGFQVLRFWNHEVEGEVERVMSRIRDVLDKAAPTRRADARHPPR